MIIKKDPTTIQSYLEDSSNLKGGHADKVLIPDNIGELSAALKTANDSRTPVTISGSGTNTTGSRVPMGGVVISLERFNKIYEISKSLKKARLESGVMVEDFKTACEKEGLFYTAHPTERTAMMGGTVATNASGARSFKYGPTRRYVKRIKMALADGEIFDLKRGEIFLTKKNHIFSLPGGRKISIPIPGYVMPKVKNSAGYFARDGMDLLDLFIGQEGTLSVIVELDMELIAKPRKIFSAILFFRDEKISWNFAGEARAGTNLIDALSIEYFDANSLGLLRRKSGAIPAWAKAAIFIEQGIDEAGGYEDNVIAAWTGLMDKHGLSVDATWVAMGATESDNFIKLRHSMPEAVNDIVRKRGYQKLSLDIAVPEDKFMEMINFYYTNLRGSGLDYLIFGHIGECHLHMNILPNSDGELIKGKELCFKCVKKGTSLGGTVSAEHGIGKIKHKYLECMYGKDGIMDMARIKKALDPNCILGLDNIFPKEILKEV